MKLKGFTADKNVTQQLEIDSRRMEEKLNELKMTLNREKQERQAQGRGNIWASGKTSGTLTAHGSELLAQGKQRPQKPSRPSEKNKVRRVKVLKDAPLDIPERPKATNGLSSGDSMPGRKSFKGPACGQCESKPVSLTCMECGENYCTTCFAKFHLKGALKNHRSVPFHSLLESPTNSSSNESNNNKVVVNQRPETPKSTSGSSSHAQGGQTKVLTVNSRQDPSPDGGSLLEGEYNEEQSAASFAAALAEWRNSKKQDSERDSMSEGSTTEPRPTVHDMGVGDTSVADKTDQKLVDIKFSDSSLSYADKLLLKKHRRTEIPGLSPSPTSPRVVSHISPRNENVEHVNGFEDNLELSSEMQEEHDRCVGIFNGLKSSYSTSNYEVFQRSQSQLVITELKDEVIGKDIEVESVYSVQEASPLPISDSSNTNSSTRECQIVQITGKEEVPLKTGDQSVLEAENENLKEQTEEGENIKLDSRKSETDKLELSEMAKNLSDARNSKSGDDSESGVNRAFSARGTQRGLTKTPSDDLKRLVKAEVKGSGLHKYTDGLEKFFRAGLGDEDEKENKEEPKEKQSSIEMKKCNYQGPGIWRPSSSLSVNNEPVMYTPSPPKQAKEGRGGSSQSRRKQSGSKREKKVDNQTISWVLSQQPPPHQIDKMGGIQNNQRRMASSSGRPREEPPRSDSRIEIEGDDFARYDDDNGNERQDVADEETLEELTWELASQSGRISADGRISSLSLQDVDPYIKSAMFASSLDEELGIVLDDGQGSGLSTPYDDITMERLSEEDMKADFEYIETERDKQAVEQLDN